MNSKDLIYLSGIESIGGHLGNKAIKWDRYLKTSSQIASQPSLINKLIDNKSLGKATESLSKDSKSLVLKMWRKLEEQLELSSDLQQIYNLLYRISISKIDPKIMEMEIGNVALHVGIK